MAAATGQHHHRSTTKVSHKPFKSRFASKGALKDQSKGKIERLEKGTRRTPHQQVMSKVDRRNNAKQRRLNNHQDHAKATSVFSGKDGAPRNVAVVPLCGDIAAAAAVRNLNASLDIEDDVVEQGVTRTRIERFNQKINYIIVKKELDAALTASRAADYVLFIISAAEEVDELGELIIRGIEGQGVSQVLTAVIGLENVDPPKRRPQIAASLKSFITHFFPDQEKIFSVDARQECQNLIRSICTSTPKGILWREDRSWMLIEDLQWPESSMNGFSAESKSMGTVVFTGFIRGQGLNADRLVQVGDWGHFQIDKITLAPSLKPKGGKTTAMAVDQENSIAPLAIPTGDQDELKELAPEEAVMDDAEDTAISTTASERKGVLLDDHRYFDGEENDNVARLPARLPRGTSKYQAAWFLGEMSDSGSDMEDVDGDIDMSVDEPVDFASGAVTYAVEAQTDVGPSEYPDSEMELDLPADQEAQQLAIHRAKRKEEEEDHLEFPDEVELHPDVLARERLARYRGLKNLKTSIWNTDEDKLYEPQDWHRLLDIHDYRSAKSKIVREALVGGVKPGTRVHVHVRNVPLYLQNQALTKPLALFSLLRHELKRTTVNFAITLNSDNDGPLKSKEELIMLCGSRRFIIYPIFSQTGNNPNNVYRFERYLHPGRTAVASFTAPLTWGAVPALFFKRNCADQVSSNSRTETTGNASLTLVARGTALPAGTPRIIAKRIVLTGTPYKINRRLVTVRYMFFNAEDVAWFQALQLWTNRGRQGTIKDSLGTHGYFKAMFDGKIGMQDAVGVSLYKRVWPRAARVVKAGEGDRQGLL